MTRRLSGSGSTQARVTPVGGQPTMRGAITRAHIQVHAESDPTRTTDGPGCPPLHSRGSGAVPGGVRAVPGAFDPVVQAPRSAHRIRPGRRRPCALPRLRRHRAHPRRLRCSCLVHSRQSRDKKTVKSNSGRGSSRIGGYGPIKSFYPEFSCIRWYPPIRRDQRPLLLRQARCCYAELAGDVIKQSPFDPRISAPSRHPPEPQ